MPAGQIRKAMWWPAIEILIFGVELGNFATHPTPSASHHRTPLLLRHNSPVPNTIRASQICPPILPDQSTASSRSRIHAHTIHPSSSREHTPRSFGPGWPLKYVLLQPGLRSKHRWRRIQPTILSFFIFQCFGPYNAVTGFIWRLQLWKHRFCLLWIWRRLLCGVRWWPRHARSERAYGRIWRLEDWMAGCVWH
jgi:hypothetical protein